MWYYGRDASFDRQINLPTGRCGLAISADGIHWERVKGSLTMRAVFDPSPDSPRFDSAHVGVSDVNFFDGLYWMWYFGGDQTVVDMGRFKAKGLQMRPGCALSRDGINWMRLEGSYQGALIDVGKEGEFDTLFCAWPKVLRDDDGTWKLYYHTLSPDGRFLVGLGEYVMFYEGVNSSGYHSIGVAISDDGIQWKKDESNQPGVPVFTHAPKGSGRWDARAVGTPCVVPMEDGSFRMYYIGANEGGHDELSSQHQIGLAVSDGPNFRKWHRWGEMNG